jgi:FKBP-type peptidyl-prolyl cis-trans isomerase
MFCARFDAGAGDFAAAGQDLAGLKTVETYGWMMAQEKKVAGIEISESEIKLFQDGFLAGVQGKSAPFDLQKIYPDIGRLGAVRREKVVEAIKRKNRVEAEIFFRDLKANSNVVMLADGVGCEILKSGEGVPPRIGETVNVHFIGNLIDGREFDQMGPVDMVLVTNRDVCRGWTEALQKIGSGGALKLYVPPPLSEKDAAGFGIEPDSAMIFEIELLDVKETSAQDLADAMTPLPPEPPAVHSIYTDAQIIQTWGWLVAHETRVEKFGLNQDETNALVKGLTEGIKGEPASPEMQKLFPLAEQFVTARREKIRAETRQKQLAENAALFDRLKQNSDVIKLPDGLCYEIIKPGTGPYPKPEQTVNVLYTGRLINGTVFDSSSLGPLDIDLDKVIRGWSEGVQKINRGGKIKLYIPPELAYGSETTSGIPANSTLIFEIELLEIKDRQPVKIPSAQ